MQLFNQRFCFQNEMNERNTLITENQMCEVSSKILYSIYGIDIKFKAWNKCLKWIQIKSTIKKEIKQHYKLYKKFVSLILRIDDHMLTTLKPLAENPFQSKIIISIATFNPFCSSPKTCLLLGSCSLSS